MVDVIGRAKVIVTGDVDSRSIDTASGKIGSALQKGAAVGGAALGTLAVAGLDAYKAFEEAEAQSRKLSAVLDNMGKLDAAPAVEKLADQLLRVTGIDDEVIKGGQTILATFDAVAVSAGEVGGTFERATRVAVDMSSVFGSVESASRTLGKALSDPEKAAALLRRSNVILNEEQQKTIQNFLAAGDAAGAQDVILQALEDRYAGTAEKSATETQKIATNFGELKENVGRLVADMVSALAGEGEDENMSLSSSILKVSDAVDDFAKSPSWVEIRGQIRSTSTLIGKIVGPVNDIVDAFQKWEKRNPTLADSIRMVVDPLSAVKTVLDGIGRAWDRAKGFFNSDAPGSALDADWSGPWQGGRAQGGRSITAGLSWVGEQGPELIRVPSGSDIYSNRESRAMATGSPVVNNWIFNGPESLSAGRREADWRDKYGTRFGAATQAGAM